ncbi:MAG: methionyl-tRNA formyltransferase [Alphaproteobacteria bacterium]|jgi:methionyl-tRNA formyltransferase|nr:methionyl-tRNA formyltransferase [Alphaproteobacteria bacterium]MDP6813287.1 methionyl-tRNA formyltransferase [Alphaproteobacteria bacterium]
MSQPRIIFMGTPEFAVPTLRALLAAAYDVAAVYSQPPRPAGRGKRNRPSPVQQLAEASGLEVRTPVSLKDPEIQARFRDSGAAAAVVVAYGLILPPAILTAMPMGCFNLHASLLPRWRGAAPIQRAIMAGDRVTGVCAMRMDQGLDTGPVLLRREAAIGPTTTAGELHDELAELGAPLMVEALRGVAAGTLAAVPQAEDGATYAGKIDKSEARIDFSRPAAELDCLIRGLSPFPGAWCELAGQRVKVLLARPEAGQGAAGEILDDGLLVACGDGALRLVRLQRAGKAAMSAEAFLRGNPVAPGDRLG